MTLKQCCIVVEEEEEDKVDSDFDLDSSEGEQEHIEEGQAMDKELDKAEKRVSLRILNLDTGRYTDL